MNIKINILMGTLYSYANVIFFEKNLFFFFLMF